MVDGLVAGWLIIGGGSFAAGTIFGYCLHAIHRHKSK